MKNSNSIKLDAAISSLSDIRATVIRHLLVREALMSYLEERYSVFAISTIKEEFMKRDLTVLADTPIDLVRYATPIQEFQANPKDTIEARHEEYIHREIELIIRKYCS